jgi:hypothetical protein
MASRIAAQRNQEGDKMFSRRTKVLIFALGLSLAVAGFLLAADEPNFNEQQKIDFLQHAKVIANHSVSKGITGPPRLTLSDGTVTHDASFQTVSDTAPVRQMADGTTIINFKDKWQYNIAGYRIAKLVGLDDMVPVYTERKYDGKTGAISWWVPNIQFDEGDRLKRGEHPADMDSWNHQMYDLRVLTQLLYDQDPNLTNVLIDKDWKIWRIDFTRAFPEFKSLPAQKDLVMCRKDVYTKLKQLNYDDVLSATQPYLAKGEVKALIARRDKIVQIFDQLIAKSGEANVLF